MIREIKTNRIYRIIDKAIEKGFPIVSAQGGSRSGKSYNIMIWLIIFCIQNTVILSIVRKTLPALKGSIFRDFKAIMLDMGLWNNKRFNKTEMIYALDNGSIIEFFSTDDEQKIRGRKRHILFCNEANELNLMDYEQLQMRTTMFTILDYNPSFSDSHWLNGVNKDKDTYHFITTYKDNPFLEQKIIDTIEKYKETNLSLWKIYGLGIQSAVEGLIYPNIYEIESIPYTAKRLGIGLDFGYSNDPSAGVLVAVEGSNLYLDELFYATHMGNKDLILALRDYSFQVIADSEDPRTINEIRAGGINIKSVAKGAGSVKAGIQLAQGYRLHITKNSSNLKKEFRNYTWTQRKDGSFTNVPIDDFNHGMDAFRYVCMDKLKQKNKIQDLTGVFY